VPTDWVWLAEGDWIEVEVAVHEGVPPIWAGAQVLAVLIDGKFQARIVLPDGTDQWEDWFSWEEEGIDWRRRLASLSCKNEVTRKNDVTLENAAPTCGSSASKKRAHVDESSPTPAASPSQPKKMRTSADE